jgi:hypothetical protein
MPLGRADPCGEGHRSKESELMRLIRNKRLVVLATALTVMSVGGLAFAAWLSSGTGSAYGGAKTSKPLTTVDLSAGTIADLYPGATGAAVIEIDNPNPYPIRITAVSADTAPIKVDAAHQAGGCVTTGVSFTDQTGLSIDVPAGGTAKASLTGAVKMSNASDNACQGATFTIPVTFSGTSDAA